MSTEEEVRQVLGLMNECQDLAAATGNACFEGEFTHLRGLAAAFIARAAQSVHSAGLLAKEGFIGDAMACGRTVVEFAIDFTYIARDPDTLIKRFEAYSDVHEYKLARNLDRHGGNLPAEYLAELQRRHQEFRDNNKGTDGNWAGCDMFRRAELADRKALYELSYVDQCNAMHSGPGALEYTIVTSEKERQIRFGRMTPDVHPMLCAYLAMLALIGDVVVHCKLDLKLGLRSTALSDQVKTLGKLDEVVAMRELEATIAEHT